MAEPGDIITSCVGTAPSRATQVGVFGLSAEHLLPLRRTLAGPIDIKDEKETAMIRKLKSGEYRLYSQKENPKTGKRRNLGTFPTREAAEKHEREIQYFKRR